MRVGARMSRHEQKLLLSMATTFLGPHRLQGGRCSSSSMQMMLSTNRDGRPAGPARAPRRWPVAKVITHQVEAVQAVRRGATSRAARTVSPPALCAAQATSLPAPAPTVTAAACRRARATAMTVLLANIMVRATPAAAHAVQATSPLHPVVTVTAAACRRARATATTVLLECIVHIATRAAKCVLQGRQLLLGLRLRLIACLPRHQPHLLPCHHPRRAVHQPRHDR